MKKYDSELLTWMHRSGHGNTAPLYTKPPFKIENYPKPVVEIKVPEDTSMYRNYVSLFDFNRNGPYELNVATVTRIRRSKHYDDCMFVWSEINDTGIIITMVDYLTYVEPLLKFLCKKVDKISGRVVHIDA